MNSSKKLIIIRHADRDNSVHSQDNGLSDHGNNQVKKMVKFALHRLKETTPTIFSSPKKRCQETVATLAKELGLKVIVDQRLNEAQPTEETEHFSDRLDEFLDFWKGECGPTTIICSHGDWIPQAVHKLTGAHIGLKKCGWIEIESSGGESFLTWMVQKHY